MKQMLEILKYLAAIGVPTGSIFIYCIHQLAALKKGLQAVLRNQMIQDYNRYIDKGFAPIYAKDSFEACYKQYHTLGANGVMDELHDKFMQLPDREKN